MTESCPRPEPAALAVGPSRAAGKPAIMTDLDRACLISFLTARSNILGKVKGQKVEKRFPK